MKWYLSALLCGLLALSYPACGEQKIAGAVALFALGGLSAYAGWQQHAAMKSYKNTCKKLMDLEDCYVNRANYACPVTTIHEEVEKFEKHLGGEWWRLSEVVANHWLYTTIRKEKTDSLISMRLELGERAPEKEDYIECINATVNAQKDYLKSVEKYLESALPKQNLDTQGISYKQRKTSRALLASGAVLCWAAALSCLI